MGHYDRNKKTYLLIIPYSAIWALRAASLNFRLRDPNTNSKFNGKLRVAQKAIERIIFDILISDNKSNKWIGEQIKLPDVLHKIYNLKWNWRTRKRIQKVHFSFFFIFSVLNPCCPVCRFTLSCHFVCGFPSSHLWR